MPVVDDDVAEFDETFFGNLSIPTPDTTGILFQPGGATATIEDNDSKQIRIFLPWLNTYVAMYIMVTFFRMTAFIVQLLP